MSAKKVSVACPACGAGEMRAGERTYARCPGCGFALGRAMLTTLVEVLTLPEIVGRHPCEECGHPEMRRLPDGVFHCPSCRAEVFPVGPPEGPSRRRGAAL